MYMLTTKYCHLQDPLLNPRRRCSSFIAISYVVNTKVTFSNHGVLFMHLLRLRCQYSKHCSRSFFSP